ncbi:MAG: choloylglycine hydrolase family protein [Clostridiales bacterium]|nr:choloylglycine hydrolase family protein [Clostridiales bacterium]
MCTAMTLFAGEHYFGRNLDLEYSYHEQVVITPRRYPFCFRTMGRMDTHYAMIGMAYVADDYPLYYDAVNEKGLAMAGLNFPGNACYHPYAAGKDNIAPFELIPYILGKCADLSEARELFGRISLVNLDYSKELPLTPLHFMAADAAGSLTIEPTAEGLMVYENPVGVLTNNPVFPMQLLHLANYRHLTAGEGHDTFAPILTLPPYSRGMGALGMPGDWSSQSRFVRAAFLRGNSRCAHGERAGISQFFRILDGVAMVRGSVLVEGGKEEITVYSSCCNTQKGIYYYTTYTNRAITAVDLYGVNLDASTLSAYDLIKEERITKQN